MLQNMTSCYDLIDKFCQCISSAHVGMMHNQRECPEECREAASSLMHAVVRFADLSELRKLRTLFREKYGNSIYACVNKEVKAIYEELKAPVDERHRDGVLSELGLDGVRPEAFQPKSAKTNDDYKRKPPRPNKEKERSEKELNLYPMKVLRDDPEKSTSCGSEVDVAADKNADKYGVAKQSLSSSSSPSDEEVKQKQSPSYREITPPYIKSKSDARAREGVYSLLDLPKPKSVRQLPPGLESGRDSRPREVDDEDKVIDRLLLHYSKKQSPYEMDKVKGSLKSPHSRWKSKDREELDRHARLGCRC